ncbi:hypothetical protein BRC81_04980, partial [Halobacteriales archaeon QS_1_68_20]
MSSFSRADVDLGTRVRQQEVVTELGRQALREDDLDGLLDDAAAAVAATLDTEFCGVIESLPGGEEGVLRVGVGWPQELVGSTRVPLDPDSQAGRAFESGDPVVVEDRHAETQFSRPERFADRDVVSGISVAVGSADEPWGVLETHATERQEFTGQDADFLEGVAEVLAAAIENERRRRRLRAERTFDERIAETSPVGLAVLDGTGEIHFANERAEEILGRARSELTGTSFDAPELDLVDSDGDPLAPGQRTYECVLEAEEPVYDLERGVRRTDGERVWLSVNGAPLPGDDPGEVVVAFEDVTEHHRIETELETVFGRVTDAFYALDEEFRFTLVNERAEQLLQRSEEELLGERLWEVFPEAAERDEVRESFHDAMETQRPQSYELFFEPLDFRVEATVYPSESGVSVYFRDVTERERNERRLEESERRYRTLVENFPNGAVGLYDEDLEYRAVGGELLDARDVEPADRVGHSVHEVYPDDLLEEIEPYFHTALDGEENAFEVEYNDRYVHAYTLPVRDPDGEVTAGMLVVQDVTERWERERELKRYETIVEAVDDGVYVVDEDSNFTMVNETYAEMLGYSPEELIGESATKVVDEAVIEHINELQAASDEDGDDRPKIEAELRTADGGSVPVEATFASLPDDDPGWYRVGVVRDVTERKERDRALEKSERRYRTLAEHFPNGAVSVYDHDLRCTLVEGAVLGEKLPVADRLERRRMPDLFPDEAAADLEPLFRATVEDGETGNTTTAFGGHNWKVWATPLRDADGEIFAGLSFAQDITDQVEREQRLQDLVERLEESNERLEQFAYAASHDLQEPLRMVSSYL